MVEKMCNPRRVRLQTFKGISWRVADSPLQFGYVKMILWAHQFKQKP
jgi:hypothetical protein